MIRIDLDPVQQRVLRPPRGVRVIDWKAGRRRGKSVVAIALILEYAVCQGKTVLYTTPFASQFQRVHDFFKHDPAMRSRLEVFGCKVQPIPHLTFQSGGYVEFRSLENIQAARGGEFDLVIVDESQDLQCTHDDFCGVFMPMLLNRRGKLYFFGQFNGKNWQYKHFFLPGLAGPAHQPGYLSIVSPTAESPYFQTEMGRVDLEAERLRTELSTWRQEYLCEVLESGSAVFPMVDHAIGGEIAAPRGEFACIVWDSGKRADPPGFVAITGNPRTFGTVNLAMELEKGVDYADQLQYLVDLRSYYQRAGGRVLCGVDYTSGGTQSSSILDFGRRRIPDLVGIHFGDTSKENMINFAALQMEQRRVIVPAAQEKLLTQLRRYEYEQNPFTGKYRYRPPAGEHDDVAMAFVGACWLRDQGYAPAANGKPLGLIFG